MVIVISIVLFILLVMISVFYFTQRIFIQGKFTQKDNRFDYSVIVTFGSRKNGIGVAVINGNRCFIIGIRNDPKIKFTFSNKDKLKKKRPFSIDRSIAANFQTLKKYFNIQKGIICEELRFGGEFGLNNPAATGMIYGGLISMINLLPATNIRCSLTPNFSEKIINVSVDSMIKCKPIQLIRQFRKMSSQKTI
tara:strand:+ start:5356 stop:5934 length:579 start_codon:yes stop_codon:yes gene_type:complete